MKNESNLDRIIRLILAIIFFVLGVYVFTGVLSIILGVVMLITAATGFCLLYKLFGINTDKK